MSFKLNWNAIEKDSFLSYARELLEEALNSGKRPAILSDDIRIVALNFGTIAPIFQILEIGDLGVDKFRGIFNFKYHGDASITVTTKISASLLKNYNNNIDDDFDFIKPNFIVSDCDFDIPLNLTLSNFKMSSIIIIVFSKTKGLTLVFKNDPLENIDVNSTFDRITPIANFLQKKIESQISDLFKEFLPSLLYKFSLKYTTQSFDQFHRDLLIEEQEEDDNRRKNKILLKELDPENPFRISPGSLMRSTRLSSMRQTLSLGNGIDKLSCDRFNKDLITKAFMNILINKSKSYNTNRIELSDKDFEFGDVHDKLNFIRNFQNRAYNRNVSHKPKRRTIKMNVKPSSKAAAASAKKGEESPVPSVDDFKKEMATVKINPADGVNANSVGSSKMARSMSTSVFSDMSDVESTATSVMSKRPSMNKGSMASRGLSSSSSSTSTILNGANTSAVTLEGGDSAVGVKDSNSNSTGALRRKSSSAPRRPSSSSSFSSGRSRRMLLPPKDALRIGKEEEKEIYRRMLKLDRLVSKKCEDSGFHDKRMMSSFHPQHRTQVPPPPPYSL
ncbi:hypothetical protein PMKS-003038 [Pichia membranifaciens]|uniref:Mitochondrial distribution and morphology protein 34 n=1 Tax=Pichia membranifaciens TaxID=4926 RepID=A0A1Q2YJ09_9ASCO|nr:hypothetical protein PMKS-003038 [Pichia membranifaciens]